jgi:signal transduction histidine kinase
MAHEGEISVTSESGAGSRFDVTLPLADPLYQKTEAT